MTNDHFTNDHPGLETLSAYAERELAAAPHGRVEAHLAACPACRTELDRLRALVTAVAALPRALEPPQGVWEGIRARMAAQPAPRPRRRWMGAASLAAAAIVLVVAGALLVRPERSVLAPGPVPVPAAGGMTVAAVDRSYQESIAEVRATLEQQRGALSPSTVRILEHSLAIIDTAIAEARSALAADPANRALTDMLAAQYEHKLGLLQRATKLSPST